MGGGEHGEARSALIVGAGPAGLLSALLLGGRGFEVTVVDPRQGRVADRAKAQHVHLIDARTWSKLCTLAPGLAQELLRLGAPVGQLDGDSLDARKRGTRRLFPDRWMIDAALECLCRRHEAIELHPAAPGVMRRARSGWLAEALPQRRFNWLLDCSGTSRATLNALHVAGQPAVLEASAGGTHASIRVTGVRWPAGIIGHAARDRDGLSGCLLRRCSGVETLITRQLADAADAPETADDLLLGLKECLDPRVASLCRSALPTGSVNRWRNRRMSVMTQDSGALPQDWLALGDALLTTPPRLGHGFAQIVEQLEVLGRSLAAGAPPPRILEHLMTNARERFYAASMSQLLWQACPADAEPSPVVSERSACL